MQKFIHALCRTPNKLYRSSFVALSAAITLSYAMPSLAKVDLTPLLENLPQGSSIGFIAQNIDQQQVIAQHNANTLMLPASTEKIFTALAAKLELGDDFTFETTLRSTAGINQHHLQGDLIIRFTGDPTLTSGQLYQLLAGFKEQGITAIDGDIILDNSVFSGHDRGLGWIWNDLTMCFNAPLRQSALTVTVFLHKLMLHNLSVKLLKLRFLLLFLCSFIANCGS